MLQLKAKGEGGLRSLGAADAQELALARRLAHDEIEAGRGLPPDMFQKPEQAFAAIDQTQDGKITALDLLILQAKLDVLVPTHRLGSLADSFTPAEARAEIWKLDYNNNSVVDLAEFMAEADSRAAKAVAHEGPHAQKLAKTLVALAAEVTPRRGRHEANSSAQRLRPALAQLQRDQGTVSELFTYGAPGTASPQLRNGASEDGCFPGIRVYNENRSPGIFWGYFTKSDPVSFITNAIGYAHARMEAVTLREWMRGDPAHFKCSGENQWWPSADAWLWASGHYTETYNDLAAAQESFATVPTFLRMVMNVYQPEVPGGQLAQDTAWRMIASADCKDSWGTTDRAELYQESGDKACVLVFEGTEFEGLDAVSDAITDLNVKAVDFCGFTDVHRGFVNELNGVVACPHYISRIKSKLPHCSEVVAAGHSLGGALAELFTACANSDQLHAGAQRNTSEWQHITWSKGTPKLFPPA